MEGLVIQESLKPNTGFNRFKFSSGNDYRVKPIKAEFGGSIPLSIYTYDQQSAWLRWRRGWELATSDIVNAAYTYDFKYLIPVPPLPFRRTKSCRR